MGMKATAEGVERTAGPVTEKKVRVRQRIDAAMVEKIVAVGMEKEKPGVKKDHLDELQNFLNILLGIMSKEIATGVTDEKKRRWMPIRLLEDLGLPKAENFAKRDSVTAALRLMFGNRTILEVKEDKYLRLKYPEQEVWEAFQENWKIDMTGFKSDSVTKVVKEPIKLEHDFYHKPETSKVVITVIDSKEFMPILLTGPTGCGKTSLLELLANERNMSFIRCNLNGEMSVDDFVGVYEIRDEESVFQYGPLATAMMQGVPLICDEIDAAPPEINFTMQAVLEGKPLVLTKRGSEIIKPKDGFQIWATANTKGKGDESGGLYAGTSTQNEATLDRFAICIEMDYLPEKKEAEVIHKRTGVNKDMARRMVQIAAGCRSAFNEGEVFSTFSTRKLITWGRLIGMGVDHKDAFQAAVLGKLGPEDADAFAKIFQRTFG